MTAATRDKLRERARRVLDDTLSDVRCIHGHDCVDYGDGEHVILAALEAVWAKATEAERAVACPHCGKARTVECEP